MQKFIGTKHTALDRLTAKLSGFSIKKLNRSIVVVSLAKCLNTGGNVDLVAGKLYRVLPDQDAKAEGYLRIVDGSGESYLYPATDFKFMGRFWRSHRKPV